MADQALVTSVTICWGLDCNLCRGWAWKNNKLKYLTCQRIQYLHYAKKNLNCLTQTEIRLAGVDATVYVRFVCQKGSFSPSHFRFKKEISIFVLLHRFISSNSKVYLRLLFIQQQRFSGKWSRGYIYLSENVSSQPITYPTATFQWETVPRWTERVDSQWCHQSPAEQVDPSSSPASQSGYRTRYINKANNTKDEGFIPKKM